MLICLDLSFLYKIASRTSGYQYLCRADVSIIGTIIMLIDAAIAIELFTAAPKFMNRLLGLTIATLKLMDEQKQRSKYDSLKNYSRPFHLNAFSRFVAKMMTTFSLEHSSTFLIMKKRRWSIRSIAKKMITDPRLVMMKCEL